MDVWSGPRSWLSDPPVSRGEEGIKHLPGRLAALPPPPPLLPPPPPDGGEELKRSDPNPGRYNPSGRVPPSLTKHIFNNLPVMPDSLIFPLSVGSQQDRASLSGPLCLFFFHLCDGLPPLLAKHAAEPLTRVGGNQRARGKRFLLRTGRRRERDRARNGDGKREKSPVLFLPGL